MSWYEIMMLAIKRDEFNYPRNKKQVTFSKPYTVYDFLFDFKTATRQLFHASRLKEHYFLLSPPRRHLKRLDSLRISAPANMARFMITVTDGESRWLEGALLALAGLTDFQIHFYYIL